MENKTKRKHPYAEYLVNLNRWQSQATFNAVEVGVKMILTGRMFDMRVNDRTKYYLAPYGGVTRGKLITRYEIFPNWEMIYTFDTVEEREKYKARIIENYNMEYLFSIEM